MDGENINVGVFTRGHVEATVVDQYGDVRVIHRVKGARLSVKRQGNTPAHALNRAAAVLVGRNIRHAREKAGMSLAELCKLAGLASATPKQRMYEIERGSRNEGIRFGTLYAIALALGVEPASLLPSAEDVKKAAGVARVASVTLEVS